MNNQDYNEFIRPIRQRMTLSVWRIIRSPEETEDVLQEVLLRVVRDMARIRKHRNPTALLLRMCTNGAIDSVRKRAGRQRLFERWRKAPTWSTTRGTENPAEGDELRSMAIAAIAQLPRRQGEAIMLVGVEQLDYQEAAEAMGCSASTVRVLVARARKGLRQNRALQCARDGQEWTRDAK